MQQERYDGFVIFYTEATRVPHLVEEGGVPDRQNIADHAGLSDHCLIPKRLPMKRNLPFSSDEKGRGSLNLEMPPKH